MPVDSLAIALAFVALLAWDGWRRYLSTSREQQNESAYERLQHLEKVVAELSARTSQRAAVSEIAKPRQRIGR